MNILVDGLIVAILIGCCIWGYRSGFIVMVINFLKNIIAIVIASAFASKLGAYLYDILFKNIFENFTVTKIAEWLGVDPEAKLDISPLLSAQHSEFAKFLEKLGFSLEHIADKYVEFGGESGEMLVEYIAKPLGTAVSNVIAFILIFFVASIVIKIIGAIINRIAKLPVLNITNKILGLVLGAAMGVIFAFIFVALVNILVPYISISGSGITAASLEEGTIIYKFMLNQSPAGIVEMILNKIGVNQ